MRRIVGQALVERLADWGVDTVFGLPGDGINGVMEGLRRSRDRIRFVLVQHEEAAAFMATGYAKATGRLGVCLATSGPGAIHLLNGLYDAKLDHAPVLAITGQQETSVLGTGYQQEVNLTGLYADVASYNQLLVNPEQTDQLIDNAVRTSITRRTVAHLCLPNDIQLADAADTPYTAVGPGGAQHGSTTFEPGPATGNARALEVAASVLNEGEKVAVLAGAGALGARHQVAEVAHRLGAPVVKSLPGKAVIPDAAALSVGGLGLLGTRPAAELMDDIDTLLMVGTNFPYSQHLPAPGKVRVVQLDADATRIGVRLPVEAPLVGDAATSLEALMPHLHQKNDDHAQRYRSKMDDWRREMDALEDPRRTPIAPQYLIGQIDELADDQSILTTDSGTVTTWAARHWTIRGGREFYVSGTLASMACGLPYALAAQHAHPDRQVIAYVGDGGFAMLMAEFLTAVRHELPVTVVVNNNNSLGQIRWEQMVLGYPEHGVRHGEPVADFAAWATACGGYGAKVTDPAQLTGALHAALRHPGPALVDVDVDLDEPPMPPKVTYQQAKGFAASWLRGQPDRRSIATSLFKNKIEQLGS
jgi:pyruvate dehydrogenase (quinone)/pyruvate oxidase